MNPNIFTEQINRCANAFGQNQFGKERADMIWTYCNSLDDQQFKKVVSQFISNFKHAPLPSDFLKAFYEERKADYLSNPTRQHEKEVVKEIECYDCYETGWIFCRHEKSENRIIVFCHCKFGKREELSNNQTYIPNWTTLRNAEKGFIKLQFPVNAFIPNTEERKELLSTGFANIVDRWLQKQKQSAKYFGDIYEKTIREMNGGQNHDPIQNPKSRITR